MRMLTALALFMFITACGDQTQQEQEQTIDATPANPEQSVVEDAVQNSIDKSDPSWKSNVTEPEMMTFASGATYVWELETNLGVMTFDLFHEQSPKHVNSTIYLTEMGFYDDVLFHRVIPGFMAQGGDPTGTGRGGPAYKYDGEFAEGLSHSKAGLLSMANAGPGTDGSQFFITFVATPFLDGKHTIFGELKSGMDVLTAFEARGSRGGQTSEILKINRASIRIE